jgi:hypothetical protein
MLQKRMLEVRKSTVPKNLLQKALAMEQRQLLPLFLPQT